MGLKIVIILGLIHNSLEKRINVGLRDKLKIDCSYNTTGYYRRLKPLQRRGTISNSPCESPVNKFATAEDVVDEFERSGVDKG